MFTSEQMKLIQYEENLIANLIDMAIKDGLNSITRHNTYDYIIESLRDQGFIVSSCPGVNTMTIYLKGTDIRVDVSRESGYVSNSVACMFGQTTEP
jgi:hypothetical protein